MLLLLLLHDDSNRRRRHANTQLRVADLLTPVQPRSIKVNQRGLVFQRFTALVYVFVRK